MHVTSSLLDDQYVESQFQPYTMFIDAMLLSIFHYFVYVLKIVHRCFMVTTYEFLKPLSSHDRQALRRIRK